MSMWEPFTEPARVVMVAAQNEAQRFGDGSISPDYIILGALAQTGNDVARAMSDCGLSYERAEELVRSARGPSKPLAGGNFIFTGEAKRLIEGAFNEARDLGHNYVGIEHLMLAALHENAQTPSGVLHSLPVARNELRSKILASIKPSTAIDEPPFTKVHHVQLAMPANEEDRARKFYADLLGMKEVPKPAHLADRGGVWFSSAAVQVHLGVESDFRPALKAHPALQCRDFAGLVAKLSKSGVEVHATSEDLPDGLRHAYVHDPFGNRIELAG